MEYYYGGKGGHVVLGLLFFTLKGRKLVLSTYNGSQKRLTWFDRLMGKVMGYLRMLRGTGFHKYEEIYGSNFYWPVNGVEGE